MPRLLKLAVPALAALAEQLRFAPSAASRRHVDRAEQLLTMVEPGGAYPEDWVAFHLTGFRPQVASPELIPGNALRADLAGLIDRLCRAAAFAADEHGAPAWLSTKELSTRWTVSRKTLERLRRLGLVGRRVSLGRGRAETRFSIAVVEQFERVHAARLGAAGARTRLSEQERAAVLRRATRYRRVLGCTMTAAAGRIAERLGRARETVRRVLLEHDAGSASPIFAPEPRLGVRQRRFILRARRLGASPIKLATRLGVSAATVHRLTGQALAEKLRAVNVPMGDELRELVTAGEADLLSHKAVVGGLGAPAEVTLGAHFAAAIAAGQPERVRERARAMGYFALLARAHRIAATLSRTRPSARDADRVQTDLRWAARLKAELVRDQQVLLARTIEVQLLQHRANRGGPTNLLELEPAQALPLLRSCLEVISLAIDRFDPSKGGRLAAPVGIELNREVAQWLARVELSPGASGLAVLVDWTRRVSPWQAFCEPPPGVRARLQAIPAEHARVLAWRYGWDGPPRTCAEVAALLNTTDTAVARLERRLLLAKPG